MNRCCFFIKNKALFGSYPDINSVKELEENGVRYFVDLTTIKDNLPDYDTNYVKIKYPIYDHNPPKEWCSFTILLIKLKNIILNLKNNEKVYIHCKGGHGRSATLAVCLLVYIYNIESSKALEIINLCHETRVTMSDKSRKLRSPHKNCQILFIYKYFSPLFFYSLNNGKKEYQDLNRHSLSLYSNHCIRLDNMCFNNCNDAIYYYIKFDKNNKTKIEILENIIKTKLIQHKSIMTFVTRTGMRPLIDLSISNNKIGEVYMNIRNELYENISSEIMIDEDKTYTYNIQPIPDIPSILE